MAHVKGRPKQVWTGELPEGVVEGSAEDDRICWHVAMPWGALPELRRDIITLMKAEVDDTPLAEQPPEVQAAVFVVLSRYVKGWSNYLTPTGEAAPFTLEEFLQVDVAHVAELFTKVASYGAQVALK